MANTSSVRSNQKAIHPRLRAIVTRHLTHPYRRPFPKFSLELFHQLERILAQQPPILIFDAGCGTGISTIRLAQRFPYATVIGIDKSLIKLSRNPLWRSRKLPENCFLFQGDIGDVWRWLAHHRIRIHYHYLWYPNPWPKARHFKRRWHGHPAFPFLFQCSQFVELRTNWEIYAAEFALATEIVTGIFPLLHRFTPSYPLTPFERKYALRKEPLYSVRWYREWPAGHNSADRDGTTSFDHF